ncbi:hypothetical protein [Hymenobacter sp. YC55]|uniref:hypothetical protein n=1 Tax=Hymenobacter sp. YC55 TaxID=3034019 RepID=UPI0023F63CFB|nr:hypothetical protein [Hymenobacter sp. YC55]MDF7812176.1 hypothetical protein [Hymenobacter sp. YC55]
MAPAQVNGPGRNGHPTSLSYHPDSVEVQVGFVRYEPTELVFEVEIGNDSSRPVLVSPETFFYAPVDTASATTTAALQPRVAAVDPELHLKQLAVRLKQEAAKAEKVSWFEILTTVSNVAEDISSIKKKETDEQVAEREERHQSTEAYFDEQREQHAQQADNLYSQHQTIQEVALRKTNIKPGEYVRGYVYFPRTDMARRLRVVVFFNERPVTFDFTQQSGLQYNSSTAATATAR